MSAGRRPANPPPSGVCLLDGDGSEGEAADGGVGVCGPGAGGMRIDGQDGDLATTKSMFVCPAGQAADDLAEVTWASRRVAVSRPPPGWSIEPDMEARPAGTWPAGLAGMRGNYS